MPTSTSLFTWLRLAVLASAGASLVSASVLSAQSPRSRPTAQRATEYEAVRPLDRVTIVKHDMSTKKDEVVFVVENPAEDKRRVTVTVEEPVDIDPETGVAQRVKKSEHVVEVAPRSTASFRLPSRPGSEEGGRMVDPYSAAVTKEERSRQPGAQGGGGIKIGEPQKFGPANAVVPEADRKTSVRSAEVSIDGKEVVFTVENPSDDARSVVVEIEEGVLRVEGTRIRTEIVKQKKSLDVPAKGSKTFALPARYDGRNNQIVNPYRHKIVEERISPKAKDR